MHIRFSLVVCPSARPFIQLRVTIFIQIARHRIRNTDYRVPSHRTHASSARDAPPPSRPKIKYILSLDFNDNCRMVFSSLTINSIRPNNRVMVCVQFAFFGVVTFCVPGTLSCGCSFFWSAAIGISRVGCVRKASAEKRIRARRLAAGRACCGSV